MMCRLIYLSNNLDSLLDQNDQIRCCWFCCADDNCQQFSYITFTFNHSVDVFIQSDLQLRTIEAIETNKRVLYASAMTNLG